MPWEWKTFVKICVSRFLFLHSINVSRMEWSTSCLNYSGAGSCLIESSAKVLCYVALSCVALYGVALCCVVSCCLVLPRLLALCCFDGSLSCVVLCGVPDDSRRCLSRPRSPTLFRERSSIDSKDGIGGHCLPARQGYLPPWPETWKSRSGVPRWWPGSREPYMSFTLTLTLTPNSRCCLHFGHSLGGVHRVLSRMHKYQSAKIADFGLAAKPGSTSSGYLTDVWLMYIYNLYLASIPPLPNGRSILRWIHPFRIEEALTGMNSWIHAHKTKQSMT